MEWNTDSHNENGVLLYSLVSYLDGRDPILIYEVIPDNGHIDVNYNKFFGHIQDKEDFFFGVARGNGKILLEAGREFDIYSYTHYERGFRMHDGK